MDLFAKPSDASRESISRIRGWVQELIDLAPNDRVMVTTLRCQEPGCPPVETVIAIWRTGHAAQQFKIYKAPADVARDDVAVVRSAER
ncbi:hypothetical protein [Gemmatimonas sp.]|uniref:hypothetical protein n=1 Tax=Gemmatimonas sp. TaxID=1962908 RepID=UPI00356353F1